MTVPQALFSVHDVMPETMSAVEQILQLFSVRGRPMPALLVVPGRAWNVEQRQRLQDWQSAGAELVAHGWLHETRPRRFYHRMHSLLLSRNVAEHLDLNDHGVCELMRRSRQWFVDQGLEAPNTYIPPAWALGLPRARLADLPYQCIETLGGVLLRRGEVFEHVKLPLLGFEADTALRACFLRYWNQRQQRRAFERGDTLRISIHPQDPDLLLRPELLQTLEIDWQHVAYKQLDGATPRLVPADN